MITYLQQDGVRGLRGIINAGLGYNMTQHMDLLARNAFLRAPFKLYGDGSGTFTGTGFNALSSEDTLSTQLLRDVRLGMANRDHPSAVNDAGEYGSAIVCVTTPGAIEDLRNEITAEGNGAGFLDVNRYTSEGRRMVINGEVGMYYGTRFVATNQAQLWNAGAIDVQTTITAAISAGDGSPSTAVDSVEFVGQPGATHFIEVDDADNFNVGDMVTIHVDRTNTYGVTNGLDFTDGKMCVRRIVAVDTGADTISFDRPILEDFSTNLGAGVYGYVTKARHVHSAVFLNNNTGVVMGVAQPPVIHTPPPIDDLAMIYRVSWDAYLGYVPFEKNAFETVFLAGSSRITGARTI